MIRPFEYSSKKSYKISTSFYLPSNNTFGIHTMLDLFITIHLYRYKYVYLNKFFPFCLSQCGLCSFSSMFDWITVSISLPLFIPLKIVLQSFDSHKGIFVHENQWFQFYIFFIDKRKRIELSKMQTQYVYFVFFSRCFATENCF